MHVFDLLSIYIPHISGDHAHFFFFNSSDIGTLLCLNRNLKNSNLKEINARLSETMARFILLTKRGIHLRIDISQNMYFPTHPMFPNINLDMI